MLLKLFNSHKSYRIIRFVVVKVASRKLKSSKIENFAKFDIPNDDEIYPIFKPTMF